MYDAKGRAIRSYTLNHLGGFTQSDMQLDFIGQVLATITTHQRSVTDATVTTNEYFEYTDQGRLRNHYHQINEEAIERLTTSEYDNLGQLISKDVGGLQSMETGLQKVNYAYNIRGWLTQINEVNKLQNNPGQFADLFAFKINYNTVENTVNNAIRPLFNGNISETFWQTGSDVNLRKYGYKYDALNRLQNAIYQKPNEVVQIYNSYNENLWYDKNGNITKLERNGEVDDPVNKYTIDNLTYIYHSVNKNQLTIVDDATNITHGFKDDDTNPNPAVIDNTVDYGYDVYGNMTSDTNKGITQILYNNLNLPIKIHLPNGIIDYLYNATGVKVQKKVTIGSTIYTTDYQSGYQYVNAQLQFFPHAEGYVNVINGERFNYVYNYTDHLGNIRVSYGLDPESNVLKILEENHYYPFGMKHKNYGVDMRTYQQNNLGQIRLPLVSEVSYKYKYNGKEYQDELGLNMYDYGARNYDPAIGRFMVIDKMADDILQIDLTPYNYSWNNPTNINDPDGNCPWCIGAAIGLIVDYSTQVATNYAKGKRGSDAWTDIDGGSLLISTLAGAASGGVSTLKNVSTGSKVALSLAVDISEESAQQLNESGSINTSKLATNVAIGKAFDTKLLKEVPSNKISTAERKLDRAERVASTSSKASRQEAVNQSKKELNDINTKKVTVDATNKTADGILKGGVKSGANTIINGSTGNNRKFKVADERTTVKDNINVHIPKIRF